MIEFLQLASTTATRILIFKSGLPCNYKIRSTFMICTDKVFSFDNHLLPRSTQCYLALVLFRCKAERTVDLSNLLVVSMRSAKTQHAQRRHFNMVSVKLRIAPLIEDAIEYIRKDKARVWSLRPASSVIDRPSEAHA